MNPEHLSYYRRSFGYLAPYWRLVILSLLAMVVGTAFSLLSPWPLKILVDHVLEDLPLPEVLAGPLGPVADNPVQLLLLTVVAGLLITLAHNGMNVWSKYVNTGIEQNMVLDIRSDLYQHTQRLSLAYHDSRKTGRVIFAINNQGSSAAGLVMSFQPLTQNLLTLVGMFWIVLTIDRQLALLSLAVVPALYYSVGYYARRIVPEVRRVRNLEMESISIIHEAITMLRVVLAFGREKHEFKRFHEQGKEAVDARINVTIRETLFSMAVNMSTAGGTALVLGFGAYRSLSGHLTVGELLVVMSYIASVYKPLEAIIYTISSLQQKMVSLEHVFGLMDREPEIRDVPGAIGLQRARGDVAFEGVHFSYKGRDAVLEDIEFEARAGDMVGIVGPTGAGKTTLVSLIPRFYDIQQGRVLLDGRDVRDLKLKSLRSQVSLVLQEPVLFSGTIAENIRYGRLDAPDSEVADAVRAANAEEFINRLPKKYDTVLGERGVKLSVGERQRICIARAFLKDAAILILDEPTSAVDSRTEAMILEALNRLMQGRTTFLISHRLAAVRNADRILVLESGRLVEQGTHTDLMEQRGLYHELYQTQMEGRRRADRLAPVIAGDPYGDTGGGGS
jgi:ATP-binding cassette, subfamily B, bacterial